MIETIGLADDLSQYLVDIILKNYGPFEIAKIDLILPTHRACRTIKETFLKKSKNTPVLLPRLIPLYDLESLELSIPPAMTKIERILLLTKLCHQKDPQTTPDQALKMAISLGDLLDEFYQFETDTSSLEKLIQNPIFAEHWNETLVFLDIITKTWPSILKEYGLIDEADRRIRLIKNYTQKIKNSNQTIIAAGLDGGLPAVRELMNTIHHLPHGYVILDGLNTHLSMEEMDTLPDSHYQIGLKYILNELRVAPSQVHTTSKTSVTAQLIDEALKPEERTDEWRQTKLPKNAFESITRIDCDSTQEEALTVALLLREVLETPNKTAALITPDRELARRVISEMKRWGIILNDSAGTSLTKTESGIFLNLLTQYALNSKNTTTFLALLKHPLSADTENPMAFRQRVKQVEKSARKEQKPFSFPLKTNLTPFLNLLNLSVLTPFKDILSAHIQAAEALATSSDRSGAERLWSNEAGEIAFTFLTNLLEKADIIGSIEPKFYPILLTILMQTQTVRPKYGMHPRLDILGPIEARFHHYDTAIISGLNEGTFPPIPDTNPWLNRSMRKTLHLPQPESKLSSLAMDFAHTVCSPQVYLTRSKKNNGSETIPSRFLARLEAIAQGGDIAFPIHQADWAKALDKAEKYDKIKRPTPCPPISARPNHLSVTKIETWMRDPYSIYARYILNLIPLDPLKNNKVQQIYGSAVHKILELFIKEKHILELSELMTLAEKVFLEYGMTETDLIFYLPRFEQVAQFILDQERNAHFHIQNSYIEQKGSIELKVDNKPFTLTGTADRIDQFKNGAYRVLDYKTGSPPSIKEVLAGYAPQLPLEAFILSQGGFSKISLGQINELTYWKLSSKKEDCKEISLLKNINADDLIHQTLERLKTLIHVFNQPDTPYEPSPIAEKKLTYNDYDHLSRRSEWEHGGDE